MTAVATLDQLCWYLAAPEKSLSSSNRSVQSLICLAFVQGFPFRRNVETRQAGTVQLIWYLQLPESSQGKISAFRHPIHPPWPYGFVRTVAVACPAETQDWVHPTARALIVRAGRSLLRLLQTHSPCPLLILWPPAGPSGTRHKPRLWDRSADASRWGMLSPVLLKTYHYCSIDEP